MLSPQLRSEIDGVWSMFWSAGMTNPLTSVEQITYLLFLKRLEDLNADRAEQGKESLYSARSACNLLHHPDDYLQGADVEKLTGCPGHRTSRWSYITQSLTSTNPHDLFTQHVFPWLRELDVIIKEKNSEESNGLAHTAQRMSDAYFQLPRDKTATLKKAIVTINRLFKHVDAQGASGDVMGDLFEYLLSEIQTSGKNGQFRTPRHIIRFMIELLKPKPGERICDPAAGTGGFLINSVLHLKKEDTPKDVLRLEWDGTPRRAVGSMDTAKHISETTFVGYDNDRTMVRIGWMNMILHGIDDPQFDRRDTLSKQFEEKEAYSLVMANPPFTGNVDEGDLNLKRPWKSGKSAITNKSELLFVWLILDLLEVGGRAAIIVPEGVLFGSNIAHIKLRKQLLLDNRVEGVISLPAGVFQPYTGVKTSILIFQKVGRRKGEPPKTDKVWFYEVEADGFTLDAKRTPKPAPNDLWDALEKWHMDPKPDESTDYYSPELWRERWRVVDEKARRIFGQQISEYPEDSTWGIHELFPELISDGKPEPEKFEPQIKSNLREVISQLYDTHLRAGLPEAVEKVAEKKTDKQKEEAAKGIFNDRRRELDRWFRDQDKLDLEQTHEPHAHTMLRSVLDPIKNGLEERIESLIHEALKGNGGIVDTEAQSRENRAVLLSEAMTRKTVKEIIRIAALLDGYNILLRSLDLHREEAAIEDSKCWTVFVRRFIVKPDWINEDETISGNHDENGELRPEFLADPRIYNGDTVKEEYLDPDCIEANDYNLTAGRHKPFNLKAKKYDPPINIIRDLREMENEILAGLDTLLVMVEGVE